MVQYWYRTHGSSGVVVYTIIIVDVLHDVYLNFCELDLLYFVLTNCVCGLWS